MIYPYIVLPTQTTAIKRFGVLTADVPDKEVDNLFIPQFGSFEKKLVKGLVYTDLNTLIAYCLWEVKTLKFKIKSEKLSERNVPWKWD